MRMSKPWVELTEATIAALPAQLGVYQIADSGGEIVTIGYAGGTEPFGMRSALERELAAAASTSAAAPAGRRRFRHEFTHGYLTRWQELLMIHASDHGRLPPGNADRQGRIGRLSPLPEGTTASTTARTGS